MRPHRLVRPRTPVFQAGNTGSNPVGDANLSKKQVETRSLMANFFKLDEINRIPISVDRAWNFFSRPQNLLQITPPSMGLQITSRVPEKIYEGMIISYCLTLFPGVRIQWLTEITHIAEGKMFLDEQRLGPYRFWHHQHFFKAIDGGIEMRDIVHYALPFGFLGTIVHRLYSRHQLEKIFGYRRSAIKTIFGEYKEKKYSEAGVR